MCEICASNLLDDLNKKRNWRPDRVIKWASRRGLEITERELKQHFAEHTAKTKSKRSNGSPEKIEKKASGHRHKGDIEGAARGVESSNRASGKFLSEVVSRVFDNLLEDKFDLKLEHGFKAIEIQQKIEDKSDVENMLLELLNEIRQQELS
jgi:hypothetical protein